VKSADGTKDLVCMAAPIDKKIIKKIMNELQSGKLTQKAIADKHGVCLRKVAECKKELTNIISNDPTKSPSVVRTEVCALQVVGEQVTTDACLVFLGKCLIRLDESIERLRADDDMGELMYNKIVESNAKAGKEILGAIAFAVPQLTDDDRPDMLIVVREMIAMYKNPNISDVQVLEAIENVQ